MDELTIFSRFKTIPAIWMNVCFCYLPSFIQCGVYLVFHLSLQTNSPLSQHLHFQRAWVTGSKAGIYASACDKTHRKRKGTTNMNLKVLPLLRPLFSLFWRGGYVGFGVHQSRCATGVANLPDGEGGFLPSVHLLNANRSYLSLMQGSWI